MRRGYKRRSVALEGFTLVEVAIGSALLLIFAYFFISFMDQSSRGMKTASTSLSHMDVKSQIVAALADPNQCVNRLKPKSSIAGTLNVPGGDLLAATTDPTLLILNSTGTKVIQDGDIKESLAYSIAIDRKQSFLLAQLPDDAPANPSVMKFNRFLAAVKLDGNRDVTGQPDPAMGSRTLTTYIPIMTQFDRTTGNLVSCSSVSESMEDTLLYAPTGTSPKKVSDCTAIGGFPYASEIGVICWVPNPNPQLTNDQAFAVNPNNALPVPYCPAGWTPVQDPDSNDYWVSISAGQGFFDSNCGGTYSCPAIGNELFGPNPLPKSTSTTCPGMRICRKSCGGFSIPIAMGGMSGGYAIAGMPGLIAGILGLFCFKKKCHCSNPSTFGYRYFLRAGGCY